MEDEIPSVEELRKARQNAELKQKQEAGWKKIKNELILMNRGGRTETTFYRTYMLDKYCLTLPHISLELEKKGYKIEESHDSYGYLDSITVHWD